MSGRGAYYKQLYGGGGNRGRGRGRGHGASPVQRANFTARDAPAPGDSNNAHPSKRIRTGSTTFKHGLGNDLLRIARALGGKPYPAYRDLQGSWALQDCLLYVDHVQADPYAPPSKLALRVPHSVASFPAALFSNRTRTVAFCDYVTRHVCSIIEQLGGPVRSSRNTSWSSPKGGQITVDRPGQQVLERSSVVLYPEDLTGGAEGGIELRFCVSLPAQGRTILGDVAYELFSKTIPALANHLKCDTYDPRDIESFINSIEDQEDLRRQATASGLIAFVPNGAVLPRGSGASDTPMVSPDVIPFASPPHLERIFILPHCGRVSGMGIPRGITMIAGGGFHGKSTLLAALAHGCYNHIPGDGREFLVTSPNLVSIQGEDGRSITNVDISPFISELPSRTPTTSFSTQDASGSTSMAAGAVEGLELGADMLLFDEDTCATNFLIRDRRMQWLVSADPITPLVYNVRAMFRDHGVSSVLVIGGCGDYCDVADLVLEMRNYKCYDISALAKQVAQEIPSAVPEHEVATFSAVRPRQIDPYSLPNPDTKISVRRRTLVDIAHRDSTPSELGTLDLSALVQLVHDSQTRAIVAALQHIRSKSETSSAHLAEVLKSLDAVLDDEGLDGIVPRDRIDGFLARPRAVEVGMAINRLRTISFHYRTHA
ncbi:hypothetical protein L226DRAFT_515835 [Lentinus tigrinus ALCF2SS1-7]|uniref:ABC transporter ATPase n=1 Tax=Lentinus tigrinus ALCF2SS1-6 TaxID=1328759 RepID=A0A5C2RS07_9APHY|nr:hypothetical protein L227DRAFT_556213 [Lentinus tigrinus ALCF2SS1-6]RPD69330.1 hypothetical protein L226DRAFT_515835 [Lentinus tigrinus ALCF2SS1-7]